MGEENGKSNTFTIKSYRLRHKDCVGSLCFRGLYYPIIDASLKPIRDREIFSFKSYLILVLELSSSLTFLQCMIRSVVRCSKFSGRLLKLRL